MQAVTPRSSRRWLRRISALLFACVRLCALVLALQVGGVAHTAFDVVAAVLEHAEHDDPCPPDGPCDECPPGCPNCHCSNVLRSLVPAATATALLAPVLEMPTALRLDESERPSDPDRPSLFRPPRHAPLS